MRSAGCNADGAAIAGDRALPLRVAFSPDRERPAAGIATRRCGRAATKFAVAEMISQSQPAD